MNSYQKTKLLVPTTELAIVIPVYKPLNNWIVHFIARYKQLIDLFTFEPNVYLIFDGNYQEEKAKVETFIVEYPKITLLGYEINKGKGYALRYGVAHTNHKYTIYTDYDFPYSNQSILLIYNYLKADTDVAVGIKDSAYYEHIPLQRKRISLALRKLIKLFFNLKITDTQCGLKGFNERGKSIFLKTKIDRYLFDLEFIYDLSHLKDDTLTVTPIEIRLMENVEFRKMNIKLLFNQCLDFIKILLK